MTNYMPLRWDDEEEKHLWYKQSFKKEMGNDFDLDEEEKHW